MCCDNKSSEKCFLRNNGIFKKIIKLIIVLLTILAIIKVSYELKWLDVLSGILKLETSKNKKIQNISMKTLSFIGYLGSEPEFMEKMTQMNWNFVKHYGRGMIFEKEGYEVLITKRNYFNRYLFFEVTTREIFDVI